MKPRKSYQTFHSFQDMKVLMENKSFSFPDRKEDLVEKTEKLGPELEKKLFKEAMEGVTPISGTKDYIEKGVQVFLPEDSKKKEDQEILSKLRDLVKHGKGFHVSATPEYVEGTGYHVHPEIARRLHRGDFSIQAHLDLHGFRVDDARDAFEKFLKWAVTHGKTGVLIIHGRGLSSPSEPILKNKVIDWLTRSPWRKWIVAYSSARRCDGGAGATCVLLRKRPLSKRFKINHPKGTEKT